jgi:diguanylate cyclase (GGDEF)-like protein
MEGTQHDDVPAQPISDPLTGAYSRALLGPRLAEELSRASRSSTGCALFLFDVDYFKSVNDAYGHQRGDEVLCMMTDRIKTLIRGYDVLFRYGGDEFVLLLPDTVKPDAVRVALRLVSEVKATPFPGDPPLSVSVSLGVAAFPDDAVDAEGLLAAADRRNYLAKHRGRACAVADDVESDAPSGSSRLLERDLPMSTTREFVTRLVIGDSGALRVTGERGAGYTRFFEEVVRTGRLRGLDVHAVADPDAVVVDGGGAQPVLVVLDAEPDERLPAMVRRLRAAGVTGLGVVYRAPADRNAAPETGLPLYDTVELLAWSAAAVRVWLRTTLTGEPSRILVDWLSTRAEGLPGRVARELERLNERGGLVRDDEGWTIAPEVLRRTARPRRPMPIPMTELIGRQQETAQVAQLLAERRLVTLVGPGGIGKTRLSLAVAAAVADTFDDGIAFVPLEAARTEDEVLVALAHALDVVQLPGPALFDQLVEHLAEQSILVVFDNVEQAHEAAGVLGDVLAATTRLRALVSSRERLGLYGEQAYPVPPLALPAPEELRATPAGVALALAGSPALALFQSRARAAAYDVAITPENLAAVVRLCHRLDGLPLAIELVAAHSDVLTPQLMLEQLADRLDLPGDGPRGVPRRQQTLRGTLDWSFTLLDGVEQDLFVRLGVFHGGVGADAVAAVCPHIEDLPKRLGRLVDKSLVGLDPAGSGTRYVLLETVRTYAAERLDRSAVAEDVRRAHAAHHADLAVAAGSRLTGPDQADWMARVERDHRNLRAAFDQLLSTGPDGAPRAADLAVGLWRFWRNSGRLREGRDWLGRLLDDRVGLPDRSRAQVLHAAAVLAAAQDDHTNARELAERSLSLAHASADPRTAAQAGNALGIAAMTAGNYPDARRYFEDSLDVWRRLDDPVGMAMAHGNLTMVALRLRAIDSASTHAAQCLRLERAQGNVRGIMLGLLCLGEIDLNRGDLTAARTNLDEARTLSRTVGDVFGEAMAVHQLGLVAERSGDREGALRQVTAALVLRHDADDRGDLAESLDCLAALLAVDPRAARPAARLLGAAQALRLRHQLPPGSDDVLVRLGAVLDPAALEDAVATGRFAALDAVVGEAVAFVDDVTG